MSLERSQRIQFQVKHGVDRLAAGGLLVLFAPVLALISILIKVDDGGSILFRQARAGRARVPFQIIKFRSMIPNADDYLDEQGRPLRQRVTRVGRHLRRWSLDELPQLLNIAKGEMSFVGPRPVPIDYAERMTPRQRGRFEVRPGVTGLAQVTGRHELTWSERVELDLEYVARFSLLLDLKILARTVVTVLDPATLTERGDPDKVDLG